MLLCIRHNWNGVEKDITLTAIQNVLHFINLLTIEDSNPNVKNKNVNKIG